MKRQYTDMITLTLTGAPSTVPAATSNFRCEACGHEQVIDKDEEVEKGEG